MEAGHGHLKKKPFTAAAIFQFEYNLMRTARWLRSGAAVNIRFPGTEFRRGPLQLHSIQECRAWTTVTWSWRQMLTSHLGRLAHTTRQRGLREEHWKKKAGKFIFGEELFLRGPDMRHYATNLCSIQAAAHSCKQLSVNPRTVSCSERLREREGERGEGKGERLGREGCLCTITTGIYGLRNNL